MRAVRNGRTVNLTLLSLLAPVIRLTLLFPFFWKSWKCFLSLFDQAAMRNQYLSYSPIRFALSLPNYNEHFHPETWKGSIRRMRSASAVIELEAIKGSFSCSNSALGEAGAGERLSISRSLCTYRCSHFPPADRRRLMTAGQQFACSTDNKRPCACQNRWRCVTVPTQCCLLLAWPRDPSARLLTISRGEMGKKFFCE